MGSGIVFGHPLYGAELRLARARQLIGTMRRQYERWESAIEAADLRQEFSFQTGFLLTRPELQHLNRHHVPRISLTLGETIYNIRAALDYLVYSVVRASNEGVEIDETQFPLSESERGYWKLRWTGTDPIAHKNQPQSLNKMPQDVADDLAHYQPFSDCAWAILLRSLSNADKHRYLTTLTASFNFRPSGETVVEIHPDTGQESIKRIGEVEVGLSLPTGEDVVEAADLVQREARALIRRYASRFTFPPPRFV
jgi:hypothetical protein